MAPREQDFNWKNNYRNNIHNVLTRDTLASYNNDSQLVSEAPKTPFIPVIAAGCGTKIHNPQQVAH